MQRACRPSRFAFGAAANVNSSWATSETFSCRGTEQVEAVTEVRDDQDGLLTCPKFSISLPVFGDARRVIGSGRDVRGRRGGGRRGGGGGR